MNVEGIRSRIGAKFDNVQEVSAGVLRSVRRRGEGGAIAVYLFDLNNRVTESAAQLEDYLDDVLGSSYFDESAAADLRWNHYLYMVADKQSARGEAFEAAKRKVEADRSYARKFVVAEDELDGAIARIDSVAEAGAQVRAGDVVQTWTGKLVAAGLSSVLDPDRPVAEVVRVVASRPAKDTTRARRASGTGMSELLVSAPLASIDLTAFRQYPLRKSFQDLGRANLVVGVNGAGKTSFLESIEYLYCGGNRRSSGSGVQRVQGTLNSGAEVFTASSQKLSDFKTRQRLWYGTDDGTRRNLLPNQFGRFNFLNTDAAAELTLLDRERDVSPVRSNLESLAALLSGDEATLLWRRIQSVHKAVADEKRRLETDRHAKQADRREADAERKNLEGAPKKSDAAFAVLAKDLAAISWVEKPKEKKEFSRALCEKLSELASRLGASLQVSWADDTVTLSWLTQQAKVLKEGSGILRAEVQKLANMQERVRQLTSQKDALEKRLTALDSIAPTAAANLVKLVSELAQIQRNLTESARALGTVTVGQSVELAMPLAGMTVALALTSTRAQLENERATAARNQRSLSALRKSHGALEGLASRLRELVHDIFAQGHSDKDCPVCGTHFGTGELRARIEALALRSDAATLAEAERVASSARQVSEAVAETLGRLERIQQFCTASGIASDSTTVSHALDAIDKTQAAHRTLVSRRESVERAIDEFRNSGLTIERLKGLCADEQSSTSSTEQNLDVAAATSRARSSVQELRRQIDALNVQVGVSRAECARALALAGLGDRGNLQSAHDQVRARLDVAVAALDGCKWAGSLVDLGSSTDLRALASAVRSAVMSATDLAAAIDAEAQSGDRLTKVQTRLRRIDDTLATLSDSIERLSAAGQVLDEIVGKHSLDAATQAAVAATHAVADEIFGRIHMPAEYRIATQGRAPLVRRDNGQAKELSQVSTGQRAAYALSMFLAMNSQVRDGPRALVLDDPISHIDDLNALSFLDYLRDLVLHSQRQVFFATADEKMAGLFAHKFGFLGKDFRTIELRR